MCKNKICIRNKGSYIDNAFGFSNFDGTIHRSSFYVPCGHCLACQQRKQLAWQFRLRMEMDYCKSQGGFVWKEELTYNNNNVPRLSDTDFMCFSRDHIKIFLKKLRVYLSRTFDVPPSLKYFVCCEYGPNGTHRPHYHILLFVYGKIPYGTFNRLVQKAWIYGYTNQNKGRKSKANWSLADKVVNSYNGVEYVTKYLFKDYDYFHGLLQQYNNIPILEYIRSKLFKIDDSLEYVKCCLLEDYDNLSYKLWSCLYHSVFKLLLPFMQCSKGIGAHAPITFDDAVRGIFNDVSSSRLIPVCDYYKRRLLFDYISLTKSYIPKFEYKRELYKQQLIVLTQSELRPHDDINIDKMFKELPLPQSIEDSEYAKHYNYFCSYLGAMGNLYTSWSYVAYSLLGDVHFSWNGDIRQIVYDLLELYHDYDVYLSFCFRFTFNLRDSELMASLDDFMNSIDSTPDELRSVIQQYKKKYCSDKSFYSPFASFEKCMRIAEEHISDNKCKKIADNIRANKFNYLIQN